MKKPLKNPMKKPQFVDRKRELDRLLRALDRARDGTGDVIDIRGEAGIGKSRLIEEVTSEALNRGFSILRGRCLDYRRSPYLPFIEMLREYFKILHELSYSENLDAITKMIGEKYPNLLQNAAILIDFFYPKGEPLGSYFIHQDRTSDSLSFLRRKGFRTVIIGSPETVEKHLLEDVESIVIGDGERNSIPPGRVEELENRVREVFNKYRHVAIVFSSVKELMGANPTERMRDFFSTAASLTRMNGGVMVVPNDSDPGKMVPDIRDLSPYLTESSEGESHLKDEVPDAKLQTTSIYDVLGSLFQEIARERPLIVLIEDLHWGDKHTFNLIQHLARKAPNNRFLLLCSFRDGEVGLARDGGQSPHQEFLQRASREHLFDTIVLERFNRLHTLELVVSTLGKEVSGEQADRIFGETEGNPFMILEFLKVLEGEGEDVSDTAVAPLSASALIGRRLEGLESRSREILELGAVYGEGMTFEVIANGLEMESEEVLDLIEGLISQRFLKEKDELIVFEHSRVREAICELIPGDDLKLYHMIVASLLEGKQGEDKRKELSNLANHYFKGEDFNKALEYLLEAAESEYKGHSHHESLAHYNDCLTCLSMIEETEESNTQKLKVLQRKGDVLEELGQFQKAMESYEEALGIAEKKGVIYGLASSYKRMGDITQHFYHWDVVTDYYLRSMHLALKLDDHRELAITFRGMGRMYFLKGEYNRALECYIRYFERPLVQKGADYMRGLLWMGDLYCEIGDLNQALTYYKLAIKAGEEKENQPETALGYVKMSKVLMKLGEAEDARRFCTWAISLSKEIHNVSLYPWIILHYSEQMIELGELDKAKSGLESIANLDYDPLQDELFKGMYHRLMGTLFSKERDFTRAVTHFETGKEILESIKIPFQLAQNQLQYGLLKFQNMDVEGALELVEEANSIFTGINALHLMNHTSSKLRELRFVRDGPAR